MQFGALFGDKNASGIVLLKSYEDYYYGYEDEKGRCKEKIYTEDEMLALAGISSEEEQRNLKIEANPNIHELGIYFQNKSALKRAQEEIMNLNNTIQVGDATLGITK